MTQKLSLVLTTCLFLNTGFSATPSITACDINQLTLYPIANYFPGMSHGSNFYILKNSTDKTCFLPSGTKLSLSVKGEINKGFSCATSQNQSNTLDHDVMVASQIDHPRMSLNDAWMAVDLGFAYTSDQPQYVGNTTSLSLSANQSLSQATSFTEKNVGISQCYLPESGYALFFKPPFASRLSNCNTSQTPTSNQKSINLMSAPLEHRTYYCD
ncbi:MAG TPA: hypothetical protein DCL40_05680 [Coxiellaceae bacterium]|nr:hypothetical protein [Coxiellaceae bacterium]